MSVTLHSGLAGVSIRIIDTIVQAEMHKYDDVDMNKAEPYSPEAARIAAQARNIALLDH